MSFASRQRFFVSLRYRLLTLVLVPLLLLCTTVIILAVLWSREFGYQQLFTRVNADLRVAHDQFQQIQLRGQQQLESLAGSAQLNRALARGDLDTLSDLLDTERRLTRFDVLHLLSADATQYLSLAAGTALSAVPYASQRIDLVDHDALKRPADTPSSVAARVSSQRAAWQPYSLKPSRLTETLLASQAAPSLSGIEVYERAQWQQLRQLEARDVVLPLVYTLRATDTDRRQEDRAMMIRILQPVFDELGSRIAILEAGVLLNRNYDLVDRIRDLVYSPGSLIPGSQGTVTVFLDDVRISTNVPDTDGQRALGTRVSDEVRQAVLERGESWIDRAFVVNTWYVSAYEPIVDVNGQRVGMLYTGYLDAPFRTQLFNAVSILSVLVLLGSLAAAVAAIWGGTHGVCTD